MTTPPEPQSSNPPNPQPPHAATQPDSASGNGGANPPVIVQPQGPDTGVQRQLSQFGQQLAALPESIVSAFREATQPAQPPRNDGPSPSADQGANQGGNQGQAPGSSTAPPPPPASATQQMTGGTGVGRKPSRIAQWWFKR